jgi:hypothetical protein
MSTGKRIEAVRPTGTVLERCVRAAPFDLEDGGRRGEEEPLSNMK